MLVNRYTDGKDDLNFEIFASGGHAWFNTGPNSEFSLGSEGLMIAAFSSPLKTRLHVHATKLVFFALARGFGYV